MGQNPEIYESETDFNTLIASEPTGEKLFKFTGGISKWGDVRKFYLKMETVDGKNLIIQAIKNKFDEIESKVRESL